MISKMLLECGAALVIHDAEQLAEVLRQWLSDASRRATAGEAGRQMVERNRGALDRLYSLLLERLQQEPGGQ
jgi:3-deoxy-D-manno-octulosonic-acid transferase